MSFTASPVETTPAFFEAIYAEARGDASLIPWEDGAPSPALVNWLNVAAPGLIRCGARVAVVGCGLGHDAAELVRRGYDVVAFDCSPSAVEWARSVHPACADCFAHADLLEPPGRWRHRFDLVVEINTLGALQPHLRQEAADAMSDLLTPHGRLLVICRGAEEPAGPEDGPPWAFTETELRDVMTSAGLSPEGPISSFDDEQEPPVLRMRAVFVRA